MTDTEVLSDLMSQRIKLDTRILKEKIKKAKKEGIVFSSIQDLMKKKYSGKEFLYKVGKPINNSERVSPVGKGKNILLKKGKKLNTYLIVNNNRKSIFASEMVYDCPNCGVVLGEVKKKHFHSSEESWHALAGREGDHYHCKVCDMQLGYYYSKIS